MFRALLLAAFLGVSVALSAPAPLPRVRPAGPLLAPGKWHLWWSGTRYLLHLDVSGVCRCELPPYYASRGTWVYDERERVLEVQEVSGDGIGLEGKIWLVRFLADGTGQAWGDYGVHEVKVGRAKR